MTERFEDIKEEEKKQDFIGKYQDEETEESTELYEHFRIVADPGQSLVRIDKFLQNRMENVSRNRIQNAAKAGSILVNGNPVKQNYKIKPNDVVSIVHPEHHQHPAGCRNLCQRRLRLRQGSPQPHSDRHEPGSGDYGRIFPHFPVQGHHPGRIG